MKRISYLFLMLFLCITFSYTFAGININNYNVTAWKRDQVVTGTVDFPASAGILYVNNKTYNFNIANNEFSVAILIEEGINHIVAKADSMGTELLSDTIDITLGYKLRPEVYAYAEVSGRSINLHTQVIENPDSASLSFQWIADERNPFALSINGAADSNASITIPEGAPNGEYYFNLYTIETGGDTSKSRTFVSVAGQDIHSFRIKDDYAAWIDSAVIYEITPYIFVNGGSDFDDITNKIPQIKNLGVTTLWLQPIFRTHNGGQGYDITDYFSIRPDLGTETDLRELIQTAKAHGLRVLFDFVANHSSINHPYAVDSKKGSSSYYYNFYQRETDNAPYSEHYHHYQGFINYFWNDLPNLNYDNPEVQKWITEAAKYWIENFDIDGYRFDAVWGVTARNPEFTKQLRLALKRLKPEILMLAEDKASQPQVFDERFDVAYDWAPETGWVSQWVWQWDFSEDSNPTIFNNGSNRSTLLRNSLNNNGNGYAPDAKILRFLQNNDTYPFITHHGVERTRMAAALLFSLHGIPLIYNGQEIGKEEHPYSTEFIFYPGRPMNYDDTYGLFQYYSRLSYLRKTFTSLISNNFSEVPVSPGNNNFAFRRWEGDQNIFTLLNMASGESTANITLPIDELNLDSAKTYYLTDLLTGYSVSGLPENLNSVAIPMPGYSAKIMLLADSIPTVVSVDEDIADNTPSEFMLMQNYPNPFNPVTNFNFNITETGNVSLKIYDILGKEAAVLVNEVKAPGKYSIMFNAEGFSSGIYFAKLESGANQMIKKIVLLK